MKKVLFVATVAGHILFHIPYLKMFKNKGYRTYVAAKWNLGGKIELDNVDEIINLQIQRSPLSMKNVKAIKELKLLIEKEKFDIIHCHTPVGGVVARLAARSARKKYGTRVIYTAHGFHFYKGAPLKNWIMFFPVEYFLAKYTDTLITINHDDYEFAKKRFKNRCKDIQYVPGVGIDTKKFNIKLADKEKKDLRKSLGLKEDDFVLTCAARLDRNKNQGFLIDCMQKIIKIHSNVHLLLAGTDELSGYYQKIANDYGVNSNVHFLGRREDIPQLLKITNIVVSASKREGLPVNVLESFACNVPVVALSCRGMKDLIDNGVNGYIVDINSETKEDEFIKCILKYYNGRKYQYSKKIDGTDISNTIKEMEKIYFS